MRAPSGVHPVRASVENCFNASDLAFFDFKQLCELPGPIDLHVIEETKGKDNSTFTVHCHEAAIADPRHNAFQLSFKLLLAFSG